MTVRMTCSVPLTGYWKMATVRRRALRQWCLVKKSYVKSVKLKPFRRTTMVQMITMAREDKIVRLVNIMANGVRSPSEDVVVEMEVQDQNEPIDRLEEIRKMVKMKIAKIRMKIVVTGGRLGNDRIVMVTGL